MEQGFIYDIKVTAFSNRVCMYYITNGRPNKACQSITAART